MGGGKPSKTHRRTTLSTQTRDTSPLSRRRLLRRGGAVAAGAAALSLAGLGAASAQSHHPMAAPLTATPAEGLRAAMRRLWEDHIVLTRMFIVGAVAGTPDAGPAAERLLRNQTEIGDAVKPFYGEAAGAKLTELLRDHILGAADLLTAVKSGDAKAAALQERWYANGDEIAAFLNAANPTAWPLATLRTVMRGHLDHTLEEAGARLKGDWAADIAAYDKVHEHALGMADALSEGLIKQFPERFAGGDTVVVPDLRGLDEAEATRRIGAAGLAATANNHQSVEQVAPGARDYFLSKQPGQVVSQMPAPGQRVAPGTAVHLAVRKS